MSKSIVNDNDKKHYQKINRLFPSIENGADDEKDRVSPFKWRNKI